MASGSSTPTLGGSPVVLTPTLATSPIAVVSPKIGGLLLVTVGSSGLTLNLPWTGGQPTVAWDATLNPKPTFVSCYRPAPGAVDHTKTFIAVTKSLDKKFESGDASYPLSAFESAVWKHLRDCGLDSVFYVLDKDALEMVEIIHKHSRFLMSHVKDFISDKLDTHMADCYDPYDIDNLQFSHAFLIESLGPDLKRSVELKSNDLTPGPILWMMIVEEAQSDSSRRQLRIKTELRSLQLKTYAGENVKSFNKHALGLFRELDYGDVLEDDLLLCLLQSYCKATTEEFRISFITMRRDLESYL